MIAPVLQSEWPEDVLALYRHDVQEVWDPRIATHIWNQYHNQLDLYLALLDHRRPLTVLDVGCAQATLAILLAEKGHRVWAMDIRQNFLDYAASRYEKGEIHFVCGNAMEMDFDVHFDVIFANQILEHLVHPDTLIRRLMSWLNPGGRLIASTPNGKYLMNKLPAFSQIGDPQQHEHRQFSADADGHFFAYTRAELLQIFLGAGLQDVEVRHFESPFISGHMKVRYVHTFVPVGVLRGTDRLLLALPGIGHRLAHQLLAIGKR